MNIQKILLLTLLLILPSSLPASPIQNFSFTDINGKTWSGPDLLGTQMVVNIGSHW